MGCCRAGVNCSDPNAHSGGGNCKCNAWLSACVSRVVGLKLAYHRFGVQVVRTSRAERIIAEARARYGGDGMRALHNKSRGVADLKHLLQGM